MTINNLPELPAQLDCAGLILDLSVPHVMAVLNVTPDSFSDGGRYVSNAAGSVNLDAALKTVEQMISDGATIIDVGGESTRPGAEVVGPQQEMDRVLPVVEAVRKRFDVVVSVDTSTPKLMTSAAAAGAGLINDVRALSRDGAMQAARDSGLPVCLMHMQGEPQTMQQTPRYDDVVKDVIDYLDARVKACCEAGIDRHKLLLDPGFGFGKTLQHNLELLDRLEEFDSLQLPLLVGMSRKSMVGQVLDKPVDERLFGSLAVAVMAVAKGAHIVRCHDVAATADVVKMTAAVMRRGV
ncbi:MAG: dihydropteroate synthase [Pseudomonadales bacterium]